MQRLFLHTSNRLEVLADGLAEVLRRPLGSPFTPEIIVVPSLGMARWLKLELARRLGVWANGNFPSPDGFAQNFFAQALPGTPKTTPFRREVLTWALMDLLPGIQAVEHYLRADDPRRSFQLAGKLAALFELYPVHRPDLVLNWQDGTDDHWQAGLWRQVVERLGEQHAAALLDRLAQGEVPAEAALPERFCVFGVPALPRFHLDLLAWLGLRTEVHLFRLEPCQEFWGHIRTRKQQQRALARAQRGADEGEALHFETGPRLLASLGQAGKSFLELLLDSGDWEDDCDFRSPGTGTLLHSLQDDILHFRHRWHDEEHGVMEIQADDHSLLIHSCHSPMREVEVLQDHLLDWFQRDPTLTPRDVLVMTTDIETYAPAIQAVFESPEDETRRIRFSLADRAARRESRVVDTFLRLLALPDSRLTSAEVLAPLETPAVLASFGLTEADVQLLRRWVGETNVRWGRDAEHKAELGLPALPENTWRQGLDRLLLGCALPGDGQTVFAGLLPYAEIEGDATEILGRACAYFDAIFALAKTLNQPRRLADWRDLLVGLLDGFFTEDEDSAEEVGVLRAALTELASHAKRAGFEGEVALAVVQEALTEALSGDRYGSGFLTGGVTFCALRPMRSIPFRVIAVLGLNDGVFPRGDARLSFDLMAEKPRPGDRSAREEDRYLFLETLLSARDRLHLSYVGQSAQDGGVLPPSVVIGELLDTVKEGFRLAGAGAEALVERLQVRHRLHAFASRYFEGDDRLFSYSGQNFVASREASRERGQPRAFFTAPLAAPEESFRAVEVDTLITFFCHPAKFLLTRRLGLRFPREEAPLQEREPFAVEGLEAYTLTEELVEACLAGRPLDRDQAAVLRAAGRLPPGASAETWFAAQKKQALILADKAATFSEGLAPARQEVDFTLGDFRVHGVVPNVFGTRLVLWRAVKEPGAKDYLRLWLSLLAVNAATERPLLSGGTALGFSNDKGTVLFKSPVDARAVFEKLLGLYWNGLVKPLPLFPRTSLAYAEALHKGANAALEAARKQWEGDEYGPGPESGDEYFHQCFGDTEPFNDEFTRTAEDVFGVMLAHLG